MVHGLASIWEARDVADDVKKVWNAAKGGWEILHGPVTTSNTT